MTKFFNEFKKPYFWPIFPIFRAIKKKENSSATHNFIFQEKVCTDRQMDGPSLFIGSFRLPLGVQKYNLGSKWVLKPSFPYYTAKLQVP